MKYLLSSTTAIIAIVLLYGQDKQTVNVGLVASSWWLVVGGWQLISITFSRHSPGRGTNHVFR